MVSKQAQEFWKTLQTYPKQIQMPLAQARDADVRSEDFTPEPAGVTFTPAPEVEGLWAEPPDVLPGRAILYFFGERWTSAIYSHLQSKGWRIEREHSLVKDFPVQFLAASGLTEEAVRNAHRSKMKACPQRFSALN